MRLTIRSQFSVARCFWTAARRGQNTRSIVRRKKPATIWFTETNESIPLEKAPLRNIGLPKRLAGWLAGWLGCLIAWLPGCLPDCVAALLVWRRGNLSFYTTRHPTFLHSRPWVRWLAPSQRVRGGLSCCCFDSSSIAARRSGREGPPQSSLGRLTTRGAAEKPSMLTSALTASALKQHTLPGLREPWAPLLSTLPSPSTSV